MVIQVVMQVVIGATVITVDKVFYFTSYFFFETPKLRPLPIPSFAQKNRKTQMEKTQMEKPNRKTQIEKPKWKN